MAIKNSAAVYINGINLTAFTVAPLKWGNFLDEQLDEMYLALRHCPIENFKPLTPIEIHFKNELYFDSTTVDTQTKIKRYLVADDSNAEENPVGRKLYNHDLYLIEITKYAECIVVDTITFTNDLGRSYTKDAKPVTPEETGDNNQLNIVYPQGYKNPMPVGESFTFPAPHSVYTVEPVGGAYVDTDKCTYKLTVSQNGSALFSETYTLSAGGSSSGQNESYTTILEDGATYTALYECSRTVHATGPGGGGGYTYSGTLSYSFSVVENYYPLKTLTIKDVINRLLDVAEPLRQGENPRFVLQGINPLTGAVTAGSQADKFDKIIAPQFSFTKQTLRECLREIGGVVHGEPRLSIAQDTNGKFYFEVSYDLYGQTDRAGIWAKRYIQKTVSQVVDSYASYLDSNAENLVNQLDKYAGVIVEPYASGYKTVRTETMYARITDANMLIQTQYPIYTVDKVECGYIPGNDSISPPIDITPYVFESSIYNTRLSSYTAQYPYSKAFGITYTQGQKNLTALNFKQEHPINDVFNRYAIINILRAATGDNSIDISMPDTGDNDDDKYVEGGYPLLAFRVTYTPFYTSRVGQTKVNYQDYPYGAALIYNQQANVIESRYYGENLKGVIARIGNVDKSITYNLARLSDIPQAGQMFDEDYYISAVSVEFLPTYIKCTLGLSKDFNRLSQYIGISSVKRYSEVSQGQAVERNTLWKEYVVIGDAETADSDCDMTDKMLSSISTGIGDFSVDNEKITSVTAYGGTYGQPTVIDTPQADVSSLVNVTSVTLFPFYLVSTTLPRGTSVTITVDVTYTNLSGSHTERMTETFVAPSSSIYVQGAIAVTDATLVSASAVLHNYPMPLVTLPVVASAFGNSISFSWEYEDNYSAGAISQYAESGSGNSQVTGYFQNNYQYTDYYGRMYYYNFALQADGTVPTESTQEDIGCALPEGDVNFIARESFIKTYAPRVLRKDNREKLQCNFQIDFVTNRKDFIIGSALASNCAAVYDNHTTGQSARLYLFDKPLNKFINHAEASEGIDLDGMTSYAITVYAVSNGRFSLTAANFAVSGKAWAIISRQTEETETVEDEEGNVTTQTIQKGGDVLIAQNMDFAAGDAFPTVYFTKKRKIFKEDVWTANR